MSGHTPGPWKVNPAAHGCAVESEDGASVAWCGNNVSTRHGVAPFRANARLIAAAPDMLAALERVEYDHGDLPSETREAVINAIAKAKGSAPE